MTNTSSIKSLASIFHFIGTMLLFLPPVGAFFYFVTAGEVNVISVILYTAIFMLNGLILKAIGALLDLILEMAENIADKSIATAQLEILALMAEKADVPLDTVNRIIKPHGLLVK